MHTHVQLHRLGPLLLFSPPVGFRSSCACPPPPPPNTTRSQAFTHRNPSQCHSAWPNAVVLSRPAPTVPSNTRCTRSLPHASPPVPPPLLHLLPLLLQQLCLLRARFGRGRGCRCCCCSCPRRLLLCCCCFLRCYACCCYSCSCRLWLCCCCRLLHRCCCSCNCPSSSCCRCCCRCCCCNHCCCWCWWGTQRHSCGSGTIWCYCW